MPSESRWKDSLTRRRGGSPRRTRRHFGCATSLRLGRVVLGGLCLRFRFASRSRLCVKLSPHDALKGEIIDGIIARAKEKSPNRLKSCVPTSQCAAQKTGARLTSTPVGQSSPRTRAQARQGSRWLFCPSDASGRGHARIISSALARITLTVVTSVKPGSGGLTISDPAGASISTHRIAPTVVTGAYKGRSCCITVSVHAISVLSLCIVTSCATVYAVTLL